jgi:hypothetical protein
MAKLLGTSLLPPAFNQPEAGKMGCLLCTYTGPANASQQLATNATFVMAAVGSNQNVSFAAAPNGNLLAAGNLVQITDGGGHTLIGQVVSGGNTATVVVKTLAITAGSSGNTMGSAATVSQVSSAAYTLAAVGSLVAIPFATAAQAGLFAPGDSISASDGTNTYTASVVSVAGNTVNATVTAISAGTAGNTVAQYATATSSSGDHIVFGTDVLNYLPGGAIPLRSQVIVPGSTASLAGSVGYAAVDGDVVTSGATNYTYFNSATAMATAGRYNENSTNQPLALPKKAYPALTFTGANAPSATYTVLVWFLYPGPPPASR